MRLVLLVAALTPIDGFFSVAPVAHHCRTAAALRNAGAGPRLAVAAAAAAADAADEPLPRTVLPISLTVFAQMIGEGIAISTLPLHMRTLGASGAQIGLATSAFSIAQLVSCPQIVRLSERVGRTRMLRACLCGAAVSQMLIVLSGNVHGIVLGRCLGGVFAACVPVAQAGVTDLVRPSQAALALSRVSAASQMGIVVGPAFSAGGAAALACLRVPSHLRVRGVFAVSAACAMGVLALTTAAVAPPAAAAAASDATAAPPAPASGGADAGGADDAGGPERPISSTGRRLSCALPYSKAATEASARLPLAATVERGGASTQLALRIVAGTVGWSLTLCVSTYCLFGSALLSYAQPQLSATFSIAAALTIVTQIVVFPRLVKRLGEHLTCALGLSCLAGGLGGFSLVRAQPLHSALYMLARVGTAVSDTATATLVARSSAGSADRARNLALVQSTRAGARIVTPVLSGWLFERSRRGAVAPGALPYLLVGSIVLALIPVPLVLRSFESSSERGAKAD